MPDRTTSRPVPWPCLRTECRIRGSLLWGGGHPDDQCVLQTAGLLSCSSNQKRHAGQACFGNWPAAGSQAEHRGRSRQNEWGESWCVLKGASRGTTALCQIATGLSYVY